MASPPTPQDDVLPGLDALREACRVLGVNATDARLLHHRSNAVHVLPRASVVARLAPDTPLRRQRAATTVTVTRWLATHPDSIALSPIPGDQPVTAAGAVATFWPLRSTTPAPTLADLAVLVRRLHTLPVPPFPVPRYQPLHRLIEALTVDQHRAQPALIDDDRAWLLARARELVEVFTTTRFPLGEGLVHADAHSENLVRAGDQWMLIDWDGTCLGPRELDLRVGLPNHFHEPDTDRTRFCTAYGYDIRTWPEWTLLRDLTELHSLSSYIRLAPSKPAAAHELHHRIQSLRTTDTTAQWHAIP
ncbi:MAG: phosphotransferase family protein [Sciscionella sp.]